MEQAGKTKLKILYILDILNKYSDEENILTMGDIISMLENLGIRAERKSVSRDLELLCDFGCDICMFEENRKGYYMRSRSFEDSELRLLIDAVMSSRWITRKKSRELIKKLEGLTSENIARKLREKRYISDRVKSHNEQILYNVDKIERAMQENRKISFQYYEYDINEKWRLKREGHIYVLSPYSFEWHEDYYYVIGNHDKYDDFTHYRVDRMCNIDILEEDRRDMESIPEYKNGLNTAEYMKRTFKMFTGTPCNVEIKFSNKLLNTIIDRFGEDVALIKAGDSHFKMAAEVNAGEGFISWILQFGVEAEVLYPLELRETIVKRIEELKNMYK